LLLLTTRSILVPPTEYECQREEPDLRGYRPPCFLRDQIDEFDSLGERDVVLCWLLLLASSNPASYLNSK